MRHFHRHRAIVPHVGHELASIADAKACVAIEGTHRNLADVAAALNVFVCHKIEPCLTLVLPESKSPL
jgi:hypothetical protein